jgi:hypothetical protein
MSQKYVFPKPISSFSALKKDLSVHFRGSSQLYSLRYQKLAVAPPQPPLFEYRTPRFMDWLK